MSEMWKQSGGEFLSHCGAALNPQAEKYMDDDFEFLTPEDFLKEEYINPVTEENLPESEIKLQLEPEIKPEQEPELELKSEQEPAPQKNTPFIILRRKNLRIIQIPERTPRKKNRSRNKKPDRQKKRLQKKNHQKRNRQSKNHQSQKPPKLDSTGIAMIISVRAWSSLRRSLRRNLSRNMDRGRSRDGNRTRARDRPGAVRLLLPAPAIQSAMRSVPAAEATIHRRQSHIWRPSVLLTLSGTQFRPL